MNAEALLYRVQRRAFLVGRKLRAQGVHLVRREIRFCSLCGAHPELFMLQDEVWYDEGKFRRNELVCLRCVEGVIDRKLTISDFTPAPVNLPIFFAYRMAHDEKAHNDHLP